MKNLKSQIRKKFWNKTILTKNKTKNWYKSLKYKKYIDKKMVGSNIKASNGFGTELLESKTIYKFKEAK